MREFTREELCLVLSLYSRWNGMFTRCYNKNDKSYPNYGGRGIKVFKEWVGKEGFLNFFEYVSRLPHFGEKNYTLDRIDVNGNYEPSNVRWATKKIQGNNRRTNHFVEDIDGGKISLGLAAEKYGIKEDTLYQRFKSGMRGTRLFAPLREFITVDGKTFHEWSNITGIRYNTL